MLHVAFGDGIEGDKNRDGLNVNGSGYICGSWNTALHSVIIRINLIDGAMVEGTNQTLASTVVSFNIL